MFKRRLGRSNMEVSALGLGCMEIGGKMKDSEGYLRTLSQGSLAWVWARHARTIPIPGFRTLAQVEENIKAFDFSPLAAGQMRQIDVLLERVSPIE